MATLIVLGCAASLARADDKGQIEECVRALATAMKDGDGTTAKKYVVDDENSQKMIEPLAKMTHASTGLQEAAVAKFGEEGKSLGAGRMAGNAPHFDKDLDESHQSMPNAAQMAQGAVMLGKVADVMTEMTGEIKDGKYGSVQEARQAFYRKVSAAVGGGGAQGGGRPPQ